MALVRMKGVSKRFGTTWAVRDIDLEVGEGERLALIGPSGCGKTTTLRMMNRLEEATAGDIEVLGERIADGDPAELRRRIGYAIQEVGLFPHYSVRQNISVVPELLGVLGGRIDDAHMRRMNAQVDIQKRSPADVARAFVATLPR